MTQPEERATTPSDRSAQPAEPATPDRPLVSVKGLANAFDDHQVLTSIDFEVPAATMFLLATTMVLHLIGAR